MMIECNLPIADLAEAVRASFAHAWQNKDYDTIIRVVERLLKCALQEELELLMYYDNANLYLWVKLTV